MRLGPPRDYDELVTPASWPLSAAFHANTKLGVHGGLALSERANTFARAAEERWPISHKSYPTRPRHALPRAKRSWIGSSLERTLRERRSQRGDFRDAPLDAQRLGSLLERAFGVTHAESEGAPALRAWPSAGGLYPLEIYVATLRCDGFARAVHHYDPVHHTLSELAPCPDDLQTWLTFDNANPALALVMTAVFARTQCKYDERGYRFTLLEAGHAMQNALLVAQSLSMGALPLGGFYEDAIGQGLDLDPQQESPVYAALFGS